MASDVDAQLLQAAEKGDVVAAQAALDAGADPLAHVLGSMTALHVAARDGRTKVVRLLLEKTRYDSMLLRDVHFVASGSVRGRAEVVELLEEAIEDAARREQGLPPVSRPTRAPFVPRTPLESLLFAIHEDDVDGARRALADGADVNARIDADGFTPLMAAARSGNLALVELLLEAGADPLPRYIGGNRASDLAGQARGHDLAAVLARAEVAEDLKAQRTCMRNFTHAIEGRTGEERFIFHDDDRYFSAFWVTAEERVGEVRWWTEAEFRQLLSYGQYGYAVDHFFAPFASMPEAVRQEAPARARRCDEILAALADGSRQLVLMRSWREPGSPRWFLRHHGAQWLLVMGRDLTPITDERATSEIEETLRETREPEVVGVMGAQTNKAVTAIEAARGALRRLHAGEIWTDGKQVNWAQNGRLYFGLRKHKNGRVQSASEQSEEKFLNELVSRYARGGHPQIARDPTFHAKVAPLVDEERLLELLEAGKVALGWNDARLYREKDGRMMRFGLSSTQEVSRPELLDILKSRRFAWVEWRGRSR